jgi:hypothetical protein
LICDRNRSRTIEAVAAKLPTQYQQSGNAGCRFHSNPTEKELIMKMQPKLIASAITVALLAGAVHAAENAGGGQPTSTPTHTVPVKPPFKGQTEDETTGAVPGKPTDRLTIKTKSSPPFAPPIEDKKVTPTMGSNANAGESAIKPPKLEGHIKKGEGHIKNGRESR